MPKKKNKNQKVSQVANMNSREKKIRKNAKRIMSKTRTPLHVLTICQLHKAIQDINRKVSLKKLLKAEKDL